MRITLETEGGIAFFPGLERSTTIDTGTASPGEVRRWEQLVDAANFWTRPEPDIGRARSRLRDHRTYTLTIEESARTRRIQVADPLPPELAPLVHEIEAHAKRRRESPR